MAFLDSGGLSELWAKAKAYFGRTLYVSGTTLYLPVLPAPWRPTSVRTTQTASIDGWHAGFTHDGDDRAYVAVEETAATGSASDDGWIRAVVKEATERETRTIALVGWSPNPARPSHGVARALQGFG